MLDLGFVEAGGAGRHGLSLSVPETRGTRRGHGAAAAPVPVEGVAGGRFHLSLVRPPGRFVQPVDKACLLRAGYVRSGMSLLCTCPTSVTVKGVEVNRRSTPCGEACSPGFATG